MTASFEQIINSCDPVLIDFSDSYSQSCKALAGIIKQVKDSLGNRIKVVKIDIDENDRLSKEYQISSVPTLLLFQNGKQLWRKSGLPAKMEILLAILEKSNS